jgi:hypothetical protein
MDIILPIIIAILSLLTALLQWFRSKEETNSFRRQLISILHHAEGIASEIRTLSYVPSETNPPFTSVVDVQKALTAVANNAESLFFGLIETKIGGRSLKDDLDNKYSELLDLELEKRTMISRKIVKINEGKLPDKRDKKMHKLFWKIWFHIN